MSESSVRGLWFGLFALIAALVALPVSAQESEDDLIFDQGDEDDEPPPEIHPALSDPDIVVGDPEQGYGGGIDPDSDDPFQWEAEIRTEIHTYDNLDLRPLDETSDQAIIDSDDRQTFAYSTLYGAILYRPVEDVELNVALGHNGLWSEDQLGENAELVGVLAFYNLSIGYIPLHTDDFKLTFRLGRQPFYLGVVPREYVLGDIVDAVVVEADAGAIGRLRVLAFDLFTSNDLPDAAFVRYIGGRQPTFGFRGDTNTYRTGLIYDNVDAVLDGLAFGAYYFFAKIGAGSIDETGADITFGGTQGNFSDDDWLSVLGARLRYQFDFGIGSVTPYAEFARSDGINRQEADLRDITNEGLMFGGGVDLSVTPSSVFGFAIGGAFYHFDGGSYASDGLQFEHGFTGFKGERVGGLNIARYAGWFPSARIGRGGVDDTPHDVERSSGTDVIWAGLSLRFIERLDLAFDFFSFSDTNESFVDFATVDSLEAPFGVSPESFAAQERFGNSLGVELATTLSYEFNRVLTAYAVYDIFLPGEFYDLEVDRAVGTSLGGHENFWGFTVGAAAAF